METKIDHQEKLLKKQESICESLFARNTYNLETTGSQKVLLFKMRLKR